MSNNPEDNMLPSEIVQCIEDVARAANKKLMPMQPNRTKANRKQRDAIRRSVYLRNKRKTAAGRRRAA